MEFSRQEYWSGLLFLLQGASIFNQPLEETEICPLQLLLGMTAGLGLFKEENQKGVYNMRLRTMALVIQKKLI